MKGECWCCAESFHFSEKFCFHAAFTPLQSACPRVTPLTLGNVEAVSTLSLHRKHYNYIINHEHYLYIVNIITIHCKHYLYMVNIISAS